MRELNKKILFSFLALILMSPLVQAQSLKAFLKAGEEAMADKDYYNAMYYYESATEFDTTDLSLKFLYGEAAYKLKAYTLAEKAFQYVSENDIDQSYPLAPFHLALTQQHLGKYEEAKTNYEIYLSENNGDDAYYTSRAEKEIAAVEWAKDKLDNPKEGTRIERLSDTINTPYSEFAASKNNGNLYYSSMRFEEKEKGRKVNRLFSKILKSEDEGSNIPLDDKFHSGGQHFANMAFNFDYSEAYYTICEYQNSYDLRCDLYKRSVLDNGEWGEAVKLPSTINDSISTNTQPAIGYDSNIDKEILFFVSNREGGKGKLDIWYSVIQDNSYTEPLNLEEINTVEDDISPFYHTPTSTLYFSTEGRLGMGGLDIYSSLKTIDGYMEPVNMEANTNSSFDDVYYALNPEGTQAHFSSNRIGSLYLDDSFEACCFDIYKADIEEVLVDLNILTFNELTRDPLDGTRVIIIDPITDEIVFDNLNPLGNEHNFKVKYSREYLIITEKEGFETDETSIKVNQFEPINKKIYLIPIGIKLEALTYDNDTREDLPGVKITLRNVSDPEAVPQVVVNRNTNKFDFDINAGYEYEIKAEKDGYETVIRMVNKDLLIDGVIRELIYMRNIDLNEYLPVNVYFDNDFPNPKSRNLYSDKSYSDTYSDFLSKKGEFKDQFVISLPEDLRIEAEDNQERFFEKDVKSGYERLQLFISKLKQRLDAGDKIELSLKGYASPRAQNKYNLAIGQRRIWTLKNEISRYENGALSGYIKSGQLQVIEVSFGEEIAAPTVSDSYIDKRSSIYSIDASKERKAEIVRVRILN